MRYSALLLVPLALAAFLILSEACAGDELDPSATLASIAHSNGVRGGDFAEELGLERGADKFTPLVDMGVTAEQAKAALIELGLSESQAAAAIAGEPDPGPPMAGIPEPAPEAEPVASSDQSFDISMRLPDVAHALGITGKELAHDLGISLDEMHAQKTLAGMGVTQARLNQAVRHNQAGHHSLVPSEWKYPFLALIALLALMYLVKWGIPKGADSKNRTAYHANWFYILMLVSAVLVVGFLTGKSPNPMEGVVKVFKATVGLYDSVWPKLAALVFFLAVAVVANKAVCGWACPFGALEELIYTLPILKRAKTWKPPFWVTNAVRTGLFVMFVLYLYGLVGDKKGFVVYHYMNPFNLFSFDFTTRMVLYLTGAYLVVSFFFYRPFCRFICPFGLISWLFEKLSLTRVRIDPERCIDCKACAKACPLTAARDRLDGKALPADCFSCMRCLRVCPTDAIHYRPAWGPPSPPPVVEEETEAA